MKQLWAIENPQGVLARATVSPTKYGAWDRVVTMLRTTESEDPWVWDFNPERGAREAGWKCVEVDVVKVKP